MTERATAAQLRYLGRLRSGSNTAWPVVRRRWPEAPIRFDELDRRQAGALIATLRRHGHLPASHGLNGVGEHDGNLPTPWRQPGPRVRTIHVSARCGGTCTTRLPRVP